MDYVQLAESLGTDLTVVGPEAPLVAGTVDKFRSRGLAIVGPTAENAALEGSKVHSKRFMERIGVPTARFAGVTNSIEGRDALKGFRLPVVLKTDGLAAGKGVIIAQTQAEAEGALTALAYPMVIEEFLEGEEVSFIVLCDGKRGVALEPSQDHKRIFDGDRGPNTGGMGAYSDSNILTSAQRGVIMDTIIEPVIRATGFTGFLYAGLMMTPDGPSVLEFNVRMGDPETQPLMMRLESDWGGRADGRGPRGSDTGYAPLVVRACDVRGDGGGGLSRHATNGTKDYRTRRRNRCRRLSRRNKAGRRRYRYGRRARAGSDRARSRSEGQHRPGLRGCRPHSL